MTLEYKQKRTTPARLNIYMSKKIHELYITRNLVNGNVYGGKHVYTTKRGRYLGSGYRLKRAIKKYGIENFDVRILRLQIDNIEDLNRREIRLIRLLKYIFKDRCYNIHRGGVGGDYYMYLEPAERLEVNRKISDSKKRQYEAGETDLQQQGRKKQAAALRVKNKLDLEFIDRMTVIHREAGKRLSDRIASSGLTDREKERNKNNSVNGLKQIKFKIIYPNGDIMIENISSKKFKIKYKTDDSLFSTLAREGYFIIKKRLPITKHLFPRGTEFIILKE